jgi:hypothetical protein
LFWVWHKSCKTLFDLVWFLFWRYSLCSQRELSLLPAYLCRPLLRHPQSV